MDRKTQAEVLLNAYSRELERRRLSAGAQGLLISGDGTQFIWIPHCHDINSTSQKIMWWRMTVIILMKNFTIRAHLLWIQFGQPQDRPVPQITSTDQLYPEYRPT